MKAVSVKRMIQGTMAGLGLMTAFLATGPAAFAQTNVTNFQSNTGQSTIQLVPPPGSSLQLSYQDDTGPGTMLLQRDPYGNVQVTLSQFGWTYRGSGHEQWIGGTGSGLDLFWITFSLTDVFGRTYQFGGSIQRDSRFGKVIGGGQYSSLLYWGYYVGWWSVHN
jgi:hypothetical protein